jgi:hypothetical protein
VLCTHLLSKSTRNFRDQINGHKSFPSGTSTQACAASEKKGSI